VRAALQAPPARALVRAAAAEVCQPWARFRFAAEHGSARWRLQRLRRLFGADATYACAAAAAGAPSAEPAAAATHGAAPAAFRGFSVGRDGLLIASRCAVELAPKAYRKGGESEAPRVARAVDAAGVLRWWV
jgi:hypothetical protein